MTAKRAQRIVFTLLFLSLFLTPGNLIAAEATNLDTGNVSLDFKDADIGNVLRILSLKSKVNIVAGPEVQGTVTIRLEDVPWDQALDVVLRTYGYVYEREGNIVRVTTKENLATEELDTETFILNYTTAIEAQEAILDVLSERGHVKAVERTNMLVVTDIPTIIFKVRQVIEKIDKATPQAFIDSKIVKTQLQKGENLGINWNPAGALHGAQRPVTFPFGAKNKNDAKGPFQGLFGSFFPVATGADAANALDPSAFPTPAVAVSNSDGTNLYQLGRLDFSSFSSTLSFLRTRANTKVLSNPRITVLNNQEARIQVAKDIPYPKFERNETSGSFEITGYDWQPSGVLMTVTPHINDANEILVNLNPEVTSIDTTGADSTTFTTSATAAIQALPNIDRTFAETQVLIRSGETIAIGGLMTDAESITQSKVPILGDIPIFGKLFRNKGQGQGTSNQKAETLFFVTVTVVDTSGQPALFQPTVQAAPAAVA